MKNKAHFGALRGLNSLSDCEPGVVIGRNQPSPEGVEKLARALYPHEVLNLPGEFVEEELGYRMRDGSHKGVVVWCHTDPRVQRLLRSIREDESSQAMDRFRLIHLTDPKPIIIVSSVPLDVTVDHLVKIRDLLGPERLLEALELSHGVLPLSPTWLFTSLSDLFRSMDAAKKFSLAVRRWMDAPAYPGCPMVPIPYKYIYRGLAPSELPTGPASHAAIARADLIDGEILSLLMQHHQLNLNQVALVKTTLDALSGTHMIHPVTRTYYVRLAA